MAEAGPFTQLQRAEGKRKAAEDAANHYYREWVKVNKELEKERARVDQLAGQVERLELEQAA